MDITIMFFDGTSATINIEKTTNGSVIGAAVVEYCANNNISTYSIKQVIY